MAHRWLGYVVAALSLVEGQVQAQTCEELPPTTLADVVSANKMLTLNALSTTRKAWDAYLAAPDDKKLDALMFELGMGAAGMSVPGLGVLIKTGRVYVRGAEWTVAEAGRLQLDAFLCGGVSGGERLPAIGFFDIRAAQVLSPGITCSNFMDRITSFEQFKRFEDLFKGYYTRTVLELGGRQNREVYSSILDRQWEVVSRTWEARTGARLVEDLRAQLRKIGEDARRAAQCQQPGTVTGAHYALVSAEERPDIVPGDWQTSVADGALSLVAPFGNATCTWSKVPDKVGAEGFSVTLTVKAQASPTSRLTALLDMRTGFGPVLSDDPPVAQASAELGAETSNSVTVKLAGPNLDGVPEGTTVYLSMGGCNAGSMLYTYEYRAQ